MKFIFMGTPEFAVPMLEKLNTLGDVDLVVSQEDKRKGRGKKLKETPVKIKAKELALEVFQPENVNSKESVEKLKSHEPDIIVVVAYGQLLTEEILQIPKRYIINIHASLLPKLRGAAPINRSIIEGFDKTGVSLMKVEKGLDTGAVSHVKEIEIDGMNAGELEDKLAILGSNLLEEFIKEAEVKEIEFIPQDDSQMTYAEKINKETLNLDFNKNSKEVVNLIRGLSPKYGARFYYKDMLYKIYDACAIENKDDVEAGTILKAKDELVIKTLDGAISVKEVQAPGKRAMAISDFLRGNSFEEGYKLGGK
ncbi:methionyl-tRNA formyltransferase [Peptoniphilus sp.]|jgi:methionyl-tRNA formyltransferase|uniref:methionyl-tRNA formyltransferase n=1 Tax=Peptoniphilus sp. TaxID=1971214 RepID=UPI003D932130